jgi:hypothetical protein
VLLTLLGVGCLVVVVASTRRLVSGRGAARVGGPDVGGGCPGEVISPDQAPGAARFPWQAAPVGRHAAPERRGGRGNGALAGGGLGTGERNGSGPGGAGAGP